MEHEVILQMFHEHPLSRIPNLAVETDSYFDNLCYGCNRYFLAGDVAYGCSRRKCGFPWLLHKECTEMPREIWHPLHPSHTLRLQHSGFNRCAVCEENVCGFVYKCSGGCEFCIHMGCAGDFDAAADKDETMKHSSHPHQLRLSKKTRWCSFPCDACGISDEKGNSYLCTICDYWIHESCALLPASAPFPPHHPPHSLSLAFNPPYEYFKYEFACAICGGTLPLRRWVYHCHLCRYVVHINCATKTSSTPSNSFDNDDEKGITKGPIDDIYEEIIKPFVKRERGQTLIPHDHDIGGKYKFNNHKHLLSFTTFSASSPSHDHNEDEEDDDDVDSVPRISELACDGCTLPIHEKKQAYEYEKGYMSCDECKYFLHLSCFNLPPDLPSHPLHSTYMISCDHNLTLRNAGKLTDWICCNVCQELTNGVFYVCTKCNFKIDIKCASLPNTIKHAAHPRHHNLKLVTDNHVLSFCGVCYIFISNEMGFYRCNSCRFSVCSSCVLIPSRNKHRLEKHWLPLTYDAYVNRPGNFYCSSCEVQMNPRRRMYHCKDCDQSFHTECFPDTSGSYRNINYGRQQYVIPTIHDHPLTFQIITKKKRCDLCHRDTYDKPGFQCATCNFVMCIYPCGKKHIRPTD